MTITCTITDATQFCDANSTHGMLSFNISAVDDATGARAEIRWSTACEMDMPGALYADTDLAEKCKEFAEQAGIYDDLERRLGSATVESTPPPTLTDDEKRASWVTGIDNVIFSISDSVTRFQPAYTLREAEARAYTASGYTAPITSLITRFADNNSMSYPDAAELIIKQADSLRPALLQLEDLRMDKYLVIRAPSIDDAEAQYQRIISEANAIAVTLK